ncbi:hypothetical protein GB937_002803 [Aspergillus fischeri]|nr:hypothetical protein GB937_002803 [Aspergillus fischeri]
MENDQGSHPFRFFAYARLEDLSHFLNEDEYEVLQRLMPLIRTLERELPRHLLSAVEKQGHNTSGNLKGGSVSSFMKRPMLGGSVELSDQLTFSYALVDPSLPP